MAAKLNYSWIADAASAKGGVPPALTSALINAESAWNPAAVSSTGCTGLGQFSQATAQEYGLMGDGFDNRKDAALNITAMVKYLAALKSRNPTWAHVIAHYSGQIDPQGNPDFTSGYARYSAGQALLATIAMADGSAVPPSSPLEDLVIVLDSVVGHEQSTGRPARFISPLIALGMLVVLGSAGFIACCSPREQPSQSVSATIPLDPMPPHAPTKAASAPESNPGAVFAGSTFVFVGGLEGLVVVPLRK